MGGPLKKCLHTRCKNHLTICRHQNILPQMFLLDRLDILLIDLIETGNTREMFSWHCSLPVRQF